MNTRLIVKNIPKHIDERRLRQHFGERAEVSDAKVVRTKDGKSRQFAFVGFTNHADAEDAMKYYHRTFIDTSRIQVERAQPRGDASIARPWSKYSEGSFRAQKKSESATKKKEIKNRDESASGVVQERDRSTSNKGDGVSAGKDAEKEEFMAVIKKRSDARFWDNDDALPEQDQDQSTSGDDEGEKGKASSEGGSSSKTGDSDDEPKSEENAELKLSDMDWLRSKVTDKKTVALQDDRDPENSRGKDERQRALGDGAGAEGSPSDDRSVQGENRDEEGIPAGRLFVRNLPYSTTEDDLRELFEEFGMLSEVHLPVDDTLKGKGFAFVQFAIPEDAQKAMGKLDSHAFRGRLLHIIPARPQPGASTAEELGSASGKSYKQKKELERKARAGDSVGWNASYVRADTVVDALADRLGVSKGDILDRDEGDMAVRLALGETQLVKENQEYFDKEGIDISGLESAKSKGSGKAKGERSDRVILVKNLPYTTEAAELAKRFGAFGDVGRVLLPPSRTVALVEFLAPVHARKAFKHLAYTRFQHVPLYLEWAPLKVFRETFKPSSKAAVLPTTETSGAQNQAKADEDEMAAGYASKEPLTIYVKNLSFSTTEAGLKTCFENVGLRVRSVSIPRKKGKGSSDPVLSMGFGFVECVDTGSVDKAIKTLGGTVLDGHALELKRSTKRLTKVPPKVDQVKRSKLIIRNVPFQATAKELRELFANFGQLKRLRLPKKFDGGHRGFAFVDFLTAQEALNAKVSLEFTHFYGRHLVGEWAEDDEEVDTLRAKAAKDIRGPTGAKEASRPPKRQKAAASTDFEDVNAY